MAAPEEQRTLDIGRKQFKVSFEEMSRDEPIPLPHLDLKNNKMTMSDIESNNFNGVEEKNGADNEEANHDEGETHRVDNEVSTSNVVNNDVNNEIMKIINNERMAQEKREHEAIRNNLEENSLTIVEQQPPLSVGNPLSIPEVSSVAISDSNSVAIRGPGNSLALMENSLAIPESNPQTILDVNSLSLVQQQSLQFNQDKQTRPPWKGVMVPCAQLKEYLDSLPTFNRKTMLRKGREVHKIYVEMTKGECFLDDQFAYTEFGKLVLTNGSIRAGRAKNAKQIVVARETLYCSGTGACKRACGGYGICIAGCDKTKMRGHRCGYRVKLTQRLGYVNFWFVEVLGNHNQLGSKGNEQVEENQKFKFSFPPNFALDLTNSSTNTNGRPNKQSPASNNKACLKYIKSTSPSRNGNLPLTVSESRDTNLGTATGYHYVLENEPIGPGQLGSSSSAMNLPESSPIPTSIYSNESSQQLIDNYQRLATEAAINAIKCHSAIAMPNLPTDNCVQPEDLSAKSLSHLVKQEPLDSQSPVYLPQGGLSSPGSQGQGQSPVSSQGSSPEKPGQKMQAAQETLGQVHNRIMERAKSRKSSRTVHIPRENSDSKTFVQYPSHLPTANLNIPNVPISSNNNKVNIDFKRFQTLNKILQSEAFQTAKQQLENSWHQSQSSPGFLHQTSALNLTKKEADCGTHLDHTQLLEEWRKGGQLQEFQQFHIKKEILPNGHADDTDLSKSDGPLTKNEKDLICRVHQLEAHVKQLQNIVIKKENDGVKTGKKTKAQREFDFTKYNTRHVALKIAYLGCDYHGFAVQEDNEKTIEQVLFDALKKTRLVEARETSNYHRCGRTDKGVSAFGQVISIDLRTNLTSGVGVKVREGGTAHERPGDKTAEIRYVHILNKVLPSEIRVLAWAPVDPEFSARFSCKKRTYKYLFPKANLDIKSMDEAVKKLIGEHDYRNLCKMDVANGVTNFTRKILSAEIITTDEKENGYTVCELTIIGSSFLWHQIRCIVGVLFLIGQGKEKPEIIDELLDIEKNPRKPQYSMSSEIPLVLFDSEFGDNFEWIYEADCHEDNIRTLQEMWAQHTVKAAMLKRMLEDLDTAKVENECDIAPWSDLSPPVLHQAEWLLPGQKSRVHKPLLERPKCDSLEDRVEHYAKKRKLNSGEEELVPSTSETE